MAIIQASEGHKFFRFAVSELLQESRGTCGIVIVTDRNGVIPVGRQDFRSGDAALTAFAKVIGGLIPQA